MSILSAKTAKLTLDYLKAITWEQQYDFLNDLVIENSVNYTDFGASIGIEGIKSNIQDWFTIFTDAHIKLTDSIISDETAVYRLIQTVKHVDTFKSIPATGKEISFELIVLFRTDGTKITANQFSGNLEQIVRQLNDDKKIDVSKILQQPIKSEKTDDFLHKMLNKLNTCGMKLTVQQLRCLSLWFSGRTSKEIAALLNISYRTVETHLGVIKEKLECRKKKEIFNLLEHQGLLHIMQECSNAILTRRC